jgi:aldose 1-epimerase
MIFSYKVEKTPDYGHIISLQYGTPGQKGFRLISVAADLGSNMYRFVADGYDILQYDLEKTKTIGFFGNPVLYPTPNRVRDCRFVFEGQTFDQIKGGKPRFLHGLVYDSVWQFSEPQIGQQEVSFSTWYDFNAQTDGFQGFPFLHRIYLQYVLTKDGVTLQYTVDNHSEKRLPYGFAIHPFFNRLSGDQQTFIRVPSQSYFDRTPDCLPTGKILPVDGTLYDLRTSVPLSGRYFDDVFTNFTDRVICIDYQTIKMQLLLKSTEDFANAVVYSPEGESFFCIENQTCMTDAHNMYSQGLVKESGLIVLAPHESKTGSIALLIKS